MDDTQSQCPVFDDSTENDWFKVIEAEERRKDQVDKQNEARRKQSEEIWRKKVCIALHLTLFQFMNIDSRSFLKLKLHCHRKSDFSLYMAKILPLHQQLLVYLSRAKYMKQMMLLLKCFT